MRKIFNSRKRLVIYLEADAYAALERRANGVPLSSFVRTTLLALNAAKPKAKKGKHFSDTW